MSFELAVCLATLFVLAGIGTPIGQRGPQQNRFLSITWKACQFRMVLKKDRSCGARGTVVWGRKRVSDGIS